MEIGVAEAKDRLSELIERAEAGEAVTITRHGRPVATLSGAVRKPTRAEVERLVAEMREALTHLPPITSEDILEAIRDGRRM